MTQYICPKPLRDAYEVYSKQGSLSDALSDPNFKKIATRLGIVATEFFIAYQTDLSLPLVAVTGSILSGSAAAMAVGSYLLYEGVTGLFSEVVMSLGYAAAGWALIEYSDRLAMGLLESSSTTPPETEELPKSMKVTLDFSDESRGVYGAKAIVDSGKLGTQEVVEFFYSRADTGTNAKTQGPKQTFGGKSQFDYAIFANTADAPVEMNGVTYKTREHYYQGLKFKEGSAVRADIQNGKGAFAAPGTLRKEIRKPEHRAHLCSSTAEEKFERLYQANLAFFTQNEAARKLLLSTGKAPIIERNNHPDAWGITFRSGPVKFQDNGKRINHNQQGLILMLVREELAKKG